MVLRSSGRAWRWCGGLVAMRDELGQKFAVVGVGGVSDAADFDDIAGWRGCGDVGDRRHVEPAAATSKSSEP